MLVCGWWNDGGPLPQVSEYITFLFNREHKRDDIQCIEWWPNLSPNPPMGSESESSLMHTLLIGLNQTICGGPASWNNASGRMYRCTTQKRVLLKTQDVLSWHSSILQIKNEWNTNKRKENNLQMYIRKYTSMGKTQLLPHVQFSIREVTQSSTGFSPHRFVIEHREQMQHWMAGSTRAHEEGPGLPSTCVQQGSQDRKLHPGEKVLALVLTNDRKFLAWSLWHCKQDRPCELHGKAARLAWRPPDLPRECTEKVPVLSANVSPQEPAKVNMWVKLASGQQQDGRHWWGLPMCFCISLGEQQVIAHDIVMKSGKIVRQRFYRIPVARRGHVWEEVQKMLEMGVVEESHSACNDFSKLN